MLAGMALDLSPRVVHKSRQESGWTKGVTSGGGTARTELPSKTQSADGRLGRTAADTSWGQGSQHCVPAPSCPSFPEWAAALGPGHPSLQPPPSESLAAAGLPPRPRHTHRLRAPQRGPPGPGRLGAAGLAGQHRSRAQPRDLDRHFLRPRPASRAPTPGPSNARAPSPAAPPAAPVFVWGWSFSRSESGGESSGNQGSGWWPPGPCEEQGWTDGWIDVGGPASPHLGLRQGSLPTPPTPGRLLVGP